MTFQPRDEAEATRVRTAIDRAAEVRARLDAELAEDAADLTTATEVWNQTAAQWASIADGSTDGFTVPAGATDVGIIVIGDEVIVNGTDGDDDISVHGRPGDRRSRPSPSTASPTPSRAGQHVVLRGGRRQRHDHRPAGSGIDFTLIGSRGKDNITGGDGNDTLLGLDGDDTRRRRRRRPGVRRRRPGLPQRPGRQRPGLRRRGHDTLYGLSGDDPLPAAPSRTTSRAAPASTPSTAPRQRHPLRRRGDDTIRGGSGDDVSYAGRGNDTTYGGTGADTANGEAGDCQRRRRGHGHHRDPRRPRGHHHRGQPGVRRARAGRPPDAGELAGGPADDRHLQGHIADGPDTLDHPRVPQPRRPGQQHRVDRRHQLDDQVQHPARRLPRGAARGGALPRVAPTSTTT